MQITNSLVQHGLLTRKQLASELGVKPATLLAWEDEGMPSIQQGKSVLYHIPTIIKWMLKHKQKRPLGK